MNCDIKLLTGLIASANTAMALSVFFLASAITANASVFGAFASPGFIVAAAVASAAAVGALIAARAHIASQCTSCSSSILRLIDLILGFVGTFTVALAASLLGALIPVIGAVAIIAALIILVVFIIPAISRSLPDEFNVLSSCVKQQSLVSQIIIFVSVLLFVVGVAFLVVSFVNLIPK